jgi:Zn ribbon nucleic-acid-binding protein
MTVNSRKKLRCGQCGSYDVWRPLNDEAVEMRCLSCGHERKKAHLPEMKPVIWICKPDDEAVF